MPVPTKLASRLAPLTHAPCPVLQQKAISSVWKSGVSAVWEAANDVYSARKAEWEALSSQQALFRRQKERQAEVEFYEQEARKYVRECMERQAAKQADEEVHEAEYHRFMEEKKGAILKQHGERSVVGGRLRTFFRPFVPAAPDPFPHLAPP